MEKFTSAHPDLLQADANIWESGSKDVDGRPVISLGLKGICYVELRVRSVARDLHSSLGASVPNAAWRLTWALASLKGPDEQVRIPGFYDRVVPPTEHDLQLLDKLRINSVWSLHGWRGSCSTAYPDHATFLFETKMRGKRK